MKKKHESDGLGLLSRSVFKILRVMKLMMVLICFVGLLSSFGKSYSQNTKLSVEFKNSTIEGVLNYIESHTEYSFMYDNQKIDINREVNINVKDKTIEAIINQLFDNGVNCKMIGKHIIITPKDSDLSTTFQQSHSVSGKVTDSSGGSLPGVSVVVKGSTIGTITDADGKFSIAKVSDNAILVFSFVGMKSQEIVITGKSDINVMMKEEAVGLDEVVAIGYGTMKKRDLTGSVSSVKNTELAAFSSTNVSQALQGRVAGVQVQQNNGHPGANVQIRIRGANSIKGSNDPLWVIDGFPGNPVMLNISDIESMEVLKDASATAIYGSRGANGVIIITTKRAKSGKMQVEYNGSFSIQTVAKTLDLLDASEYMQYINIQKLNKTGAEYFSQEQINNAGRGTNWQDLCFRAAPIRDHSLNITGGNEKVQYSLGGSYFDQRGIISNSGYRRINLRNYLNFDISSKINVSSNIILNRTDEDLEDSMGGNRGTTLIGAIIDSPPTMTPYNEDGTYRQLNVVYPWLSGLQNPVAWINERTSNLNRNQTIANLAFTYKPINGLSVKISGNVFNGNARQDSYISRKYPNSSGSANISIGETTTVNSDNIISYSKIINDKHDITLMGGITYAQEVYKSLATSGTGFLSDVTETYNLSSAKTPGIPYSGYSKWALLSYLTRLNYSYRDKYLATLSFRADGSSRYSPGSKWGYFPSGALAWRVSNEKFMKNIPSISNLKFRVGYGETGSTAISPYSTLDLMSSGQTTFNKDSYTYFSPSPNYLSNLKWETTAQADIGLDAGFLDNRIRLTADYYIKKTRDLLNVVGMPGSSGYNSSTMNVGKIQNKGIELQLDADLIDKTFKWNVSTNISFNRNKVIELANDVDVFGNNLDIVIIRDQLNLLRENKPIGVFYGYQEKGYDQNGNITYKDNNNDGVINALDKTIIGNPNPDFIYSFNSTMSYKNFVFSFYIQGTQGNDLYSLSMAALTCDYQDGINTLKEVLYDHWSPENPNSQYPALTSAATSSLKMSDRFVYDGSYLRLKNIELAYNIPVNKMTWIKKAQVYVSGQNLLLITSYPFWDPDVNAKGGGSSITQGVDEYVYPSSKSYTCGVRISF